MAPLLAVDGLTVTYGARGDPVLAVRDVTFSIERDEVFGLIGESGSGKSSVLGALTRLLPSATRTHARSIRFEGEELTLRSDAAFRELRGRRIALVPQQPMTALSPIVSVGRQLRWHFGARADSQEVGETLAAMGLEAVIERPDDLPSQFSGGQLQRLVLTIAAFAHRPALLLADEPTTTLDPTVQAQVLELLLEVKRELGLSMLYVSHDLAVIAHVCDRVGVLLDGELVEVAPVAELFAEPRHAYTRALVAEATAA